jgi:hypothetical protein
MIQAPRPAFISSRSTARAHPTHHQFIPGIGYVAHARPPELPPNANGSANCAPPEGILDGTVHMMRPPNGHPSIAMVWHARTRAWGSTTPGRGNRLGWPLDHLMKAGWAYVGPAPAVIAVPELP